MSGAPPGAAPFLGGFAAPPNPTSEPGGGVSSLQAPTKDAPCTQPQHRELARQVEELQEKLDEETKVKPSRRLGRSWGPCGVGGAQWGPCSEPSSLGLWSPNLLLGW